MHVATAKHHTSFVSLLLSRGATIDCANNAGITPLHMASAMGFVDMLQLFSQRHAEINLPDFELNTALHYAAMGGMSGVIPFLLQHGADREKLNKVCCTQHSLHFYLR